MRLIPRKTGVSGPTRESIVTATSAAHEPTYSPPLYANPEALFLIDVGNLSARNAGMGPKPVVAAIINIITYTTLSKSVDA